MLISYTWLQSHFQDPLPSPDKLEQLLTFHVFEIDGIHQKTCKSNGQDIEDTVFDVKVLPDRAQYGLSHQGIAYEISAILGLKAKGTLFEAPPINVTTSMSERDVTVINSAPDVCTYYSACLVKNVSVSQSPEWLQSALMSIDQQPINTIVDLANYTMFDCGQPLHVFDADKISGNLSIRYAYQDEEITTLDKRQVKLDTQCLLVVDQQGPLSIAGIKGGIRAAVTSSTKNIIIESAHFDASYLRKTSQRIGIRTDSSKRFENNIDQIRATVGMGNILSKINDLYPEARICKVAESNKLYPNIHTIRVSTKFINQKLGVEISLQTIKDILEKINIGVSDIVDQPNSDNVTLTIPFYRSDIQTSQDVVEEVGRLYGYENIAAHPLPEIDFKPKTEKSFHYQMQVRSILRELGFSEVSTYSLTDTGHGIVQLLNPMASDKTVLRQSLDQGLQKSLELNTYNAPLLGLEEIKIFELGTVFSDNREYVQLGLATTTTKQQKKSGSVAHTIIENALQHLETQLNIKINGEFSSEKVYSANLSDLIETLPEPDVLEPIVFPQTLVHFKKISPYPFIVRDIAIFTPAETAEDMVRAEILQHAGNLCVGMMLFDRFEKKISDQETKVSYGFRLVFQSFERTLTDAEINNVMDALTRVLHTHPGWQVR